MSKRLHLLIDILIILLAWSIVSNAAILTNPISSLPIIISPSTNTYLEVADMSATPKSRKITITDLAIFIRTNLLLQLNSLDTNVLGTNLVFGPRDGNPNNLFPPLITTQSNHLLFSGFQPGIFFNNVGAAANTRMYEIRDAGGVLQFNWYADNWTSSGGMGSFEPNGALTVVSLKLGVGAEPLTALNNGSVYFNGIRLIQAGEPITNLYLANTFTANYGEITNNLQVDGDLNVLGSIFGTSPVVLGSYITLSGQTNRIGDNGTYITYNGSPPITFVTFSGPGVGGQVANPVFADSSNLVWQLDGSLTDVHLHLTNFGSSASTPVNVFYATTINVTTQNVVVHKGGTYVASNSISIIPLVSKLLRTDANGLITNVVIGTGISFDGTTISSSVSGGLATSGSAYEIVGGSTIATNNWVALSNAYVTAKAATPHGSALAAGNRYTILLLPGKYDLGAATFTLDTDFIDIVGLSQNSGPMVYTTVTDFGDTLITSSGTTITLTGGGSGTTDTALVNLCIGTTTASSSSYAISGGFNSAFKCFNCFIVHTGSANPPRAMPSDVNFNGTWVDVRCWNQRNFGDALFSNITIAGTYIRCKGGDQCFGNSPNSVSTLSGTFIDCEADRGFGSGAGSILSGQFIRCRAIQSNATLGAMFGANNATLSGFFQDCSATDGNNAWGSTMSGTMVGCIGGTVTWTTATGTISGCYFSTYKPNVAIAATGWTNLFGSTAVVYFDGTAVTATVKDTALTTIYTNAVALTGMSSIILPPKAAVVLSGTGVAGRATVVN